VINPRIIAASIAAFLMICSPSRAQEITAFASSGSNGILRVLAQAYEKQTGEKVVVSAQQSRLMAEKLESNASAELVALSAAQFDDLVRRDKVVPGTVTIYARAGNGVAVRLGAPKPDISTPEAFTRTLLNAKSIGHTSSGTGPYNTKLFQKLGIYEKIKDKIKIIEGRPVGEAVAAGDVEIGIQQASVIMAAPGIDFVGALPTALTEYSEYGIGVLKVAKDQKKARDFIAFLKSAAAADILRKHGMEPSP
jgi:molybdate transport system substrate-binding protein